MIFRAIYNKAIFIVSADSSSKAKRMLFNTYGILLEVEELKSFKCDKWHLTEAKKHELRITNGRA